MTALSPQEKDFRMAALPQADRSSVAVTGWLFTAALMALRLLPGLAQPGMFFDGVTYATISRNLSIGIGDLSHPSFVPGDSGFYDSPPLGFLLQAGFFRALGDHYWIEKLYSALTGVVTAALIVAIWKRLVGHRDDLRGLSWLPVALWVAVPGWGWMYSNNMLENTLGMFAVLAVYAALRVSQCPVGNGLRAVPGAMASVGSSGAPERHRGRSLQRSARPLAWLIVAAAAILAAVLSKGPVGLYPLATPLVAYVALRRVTFVRALVESIALVALFCAMIGLVYRLPGASGYFDKYLHGQVLAAMQGRREVVNSILGRFDILWKVVQQIILPLAIAAGLIWTARRRGRESCSACPEQTADRQCDDQRTEKDSRPLLRDQRPEGETPTLQPAIAFCILTGISASAPIVASLKQSGHYAFPSYAFYALGLALWCAPAVTHLSTAASPAQLIRRHHVLRFTSIATLVALAIASCVLVNRPRRDGEAYRDALALGRVLPKATVIGISRDLAADFPLLTNLARWDFIGGDPATEGHRFLLARNDDPLPAGYVEVSTEMSRYRLFERTAVAASGTKPDQSH
jgi:hypothetical protein